MVDLPATMGTNTEHLAVGRVPVVVPFSAEPWVNLTGVLKSAPPVAHDFGPRKMLLHASLLEAISDTHTTLLAWKRLNYEVPG